MNTVRKLLVLVVVTGSRPLPYIEPVESPSF